MIWIIPLEEAPQHVGWFLSFEKILAQYPTIIQALIAIGTIGAVIKAVWPARVKLKVFCQIHPKITQVLNTDVSENPKKPEEAFDLHIVIYNKGTLPTSINWNDYIYFKPFFCFGEPKPLQKFPHSNPLDIQPKRSISLLVTPHDSNSIGEIIGKKYHRIYLVTQSGKEFKIKINKDIKKIF